jgi:hypothetical protein
MEGHETKTKKKKPKHARLSPDEQTDILHPPQDEATRTTLQELLQHRFGGTDENVDSVNDGDQWVPVVKRGDKTKRVSAKLVAPAETETIGSEFQTSDAAMQSSASEKHDEGIRLPERIEDSNAGEDTDTSSSPPPPPMLCQKQTPNKSHGTVSSAACDGTNVPKSTQTPCRACPDSDSPQATAAEESHPQQQRIAELEQQLSELQQKHAKTLQNQREQYDDLIQSLQLRLYISETRLKTYEQALEDHVRAVRANVSASPHRSRHRRSTSGAVDDSTDNDVPSSPTLIARAIQKNGSAARSDTVTTTVSSSERPRRGKSTTTVKATSLFALTLCLTVALMALSTPVHAARRFPHRSRKATQILWEEDDVSQAVVDSERDHKSHRQHVMFGQYQAIDAFGGMGETSRHRTGTKGEHPLASDQWEFDIAWNKKCRRHGKHQSLRMELHSSGYVRACDAGSDATMADAPPAVAVGRWSKQPWGVRIVVRPLETVVDTSADNSTTPGPHPRALSISQDEEWILFSPAFHLNPFGKHPKLTQGTIIQQKPTTWTIDDQVSTSRLMRDGVHLRRWFRPVMGTFSARGCDRK